MSLELWGILLFRAVDRNLNFLVPRGVQKIPDLTRRPGSDPARPGRVGWYRIRIVRLKIF